MSSSTNRASTSGRDATTVGADDLVCPGCGDQAVGERLSSWPVGAGMGPEVSHRDGSVLCLDGRGRISEPVEAGLCSWVTFRRHGGTRSGVVTGGSR